MKNFKRNSLKQLDLKSEAREIHLKLNPRKLVHDIQWG